MRGKPAEKKTPKEEAEAKRRAAFRKKHEAEFKKREAEYDELLRQWHPGLFGEE